MKKISIAILTLLVALTACKKVPEVNLKYVDVERDLITVGTTTATVQCDYQYIATLKKAYFYYGENEDASDMNTAEMRVVQNTLYVDLTGLKENTTYSYYYEFHNGLNSMRTALKTFKTEVGNGGGEEPPTPPEIMLPTVVTAMVTEITTNSAQCGGEVVNDGGAEVTERGICWSVNANPTLNDRHIVSGTGTGIFTAIMNSLESNTTYHVRAYATNEAGTAYGLDNEFTTSGGGGGGTTQDEYFTIESLEDDNTITLIIPSGVNSQCLTSVSYSTDGITWTTLNIDATDQTISVTLNQGETARYKGLGVKYAKDNYVYSYFTTLGNINVFGNIMSLLYGDDFANTTVFPSGSIYTYCGLFYRTNELISARNLILPATSLAEECYRSMFGDCTSLAEAPLLPATSLAVRCYGGMFAGCTALAEAPVLPATSMAMNCYGGMFNGCTALTEAPALPATTLADFCYYGMFGGCTALTEPPVLPATVLSLCCYSDMFRGCTSMTKSPALPATTLALECYRGMFEGCTSLKEAPVLPATTLADRCYGSMFKGCTSLTEAPTLPVTTLASGCYWDMFWGCTSLTEAPTLPATTLADYCYANMFRACTSLTEAPTLPAIILAEYCYGSMFYSCTNLITAPVLPASSLAENCYYSMFSECTSLTEAPMLPAALLSANCYQEMFRGCTSLKEVTCLASNISATDCTKNWLSGVSLGGTFYKNAAMNDWPLNSDSGIPSGWNVADY